MPTFHPHHQSSFFERHLFVPLYFAALGAIAAFAVVLLNSIRAWS